MHKENSWHSLKVKTVFEHLGTSFSGLSEKEVSERKKKFGTNDSTAEPFFPMALILARQFQNPMIFLLFFATIFSWFLHKFSDGFVVFSVIILNALIGFIQEYKAHKTIKALASLSPQMVSVTRDGKIQSISSKLLVPGDIVVLQAGDIVAADLRLFSSQSLACDESMLTGESFPSEKTIEPSNQTAPLSERRCIAFKGTFVTLGSGKGVVIATGVHTELGKISELTQRAAPIDTPLTRILKNLSAWITGGVAGVGCILFICGYLRGTGVFDAAFAAITLAVAAIPEGLPAIITIATSIGARRMAKNKVIIRQLPAVEALGSTSVICTDKTGTLTYNEMTIQQIWTPTGTFFVSGGGYALEGHFEGTGSLDHLKELLEAAVLSSDATIDEKTEGLVPVGDPTEIAILIAARKKGLHEETLRNEWKRLDEVPFDSIKRKMASLNVSLKGSRVIFMKGAPEEILKACKDHTQNKHLLNQAETMAKEGVRVLAVAKKTSNDQSGHLEEKDLSNGFELLGFLGMIDPPRKEVYRALRICHEAGINVKMVTGDHPMTAEAIARDLGILDNGKVVTGHETTHFSAADWKKAAASTQVFARVSPEDKLKLVEALQELGHIVAMTGDGINDAAALKRADIGVAMGVKGTAVAKEASDMILADDNFANIEAAIEEGRRVYDNLIKALLFVLPASAAQSLVIFFAILFFPVKNSILLHPMSPTQILWVNLVAAVALSLPLAFEPLASDSMKKAPRKKTNLVLSPALLYKTLFISLMMAAGTIGLFLKEYAKEIDHGIPEAMALSDAQTIAVTGMIFFQIAYLFCCRSLNTTEKTKKNHSELAVRPNQIQCLSTLKKITGSNPYLYLGVLTVILSQITFVYLPFMNKIFKSSPLDWQAWIISIGATALITPFFLFYSLFTESGQRCSTNK